MTKETANKKAIKDYLSFKGIDWFYNLQGLGSYKGITDLCFFDPRDKKLVFCEVKSEKGELSNKQIEFKKMVEKYCVKYIMIKNIDDILNYFKVPLSISKNKRHN